MTFRLDNAVKTNWVGNLHCNIGDNVLSLSIAGNMAAIDIHIHRLYKRPKFI